MGLSELGGGSDLRSNNLATSQRREEGIACFNRSKSPEKSKATLIAVYCQKQSQGYITNITDAGVFLKLSKTISARVKIGNLSDEFVENWKSLYKIGDCVQLKIIHIDREQERLEASLKKSVIERKDKSKQEGQTVEDSDSDEEMPEVDEGEDEDEDEEMKDNKEEEDDDSDDEEEKPEVDDDDDDEDDE
ncbi:hypothetical protein RMATCC62417_11418 [Rhizopus microsporus]|nr:hypothetical protein RMATCC62417_11418 [Rhizopus microsporus]